MPTGTAPAYDPPPSQGFQPAEVDRTGVGPFLHLRPPRAGTEGTQGGPELGVGEAVSTADNGPGHSLAKPHRRGA